ncbi:MAG: 3-phosphoshikimate 1-carboxyvinyltransferase, partial [Chloroflexi bacterium RBG_16_57_9]
MPQLIVRPGPGLRGHIRLPGDKSISHRAILFGALAEGTTHIRRFLPSTDCWSTVRCVRSLGVQISELSETELLVHGRGLRGFREPDDVLDCGNSGTTVRLLAGILAGQSFTSFVSGSAQLRRRPMYRIVVPLRQVGATIHGRDEDRLLPLLIRGGRLRGIQFELPVASAQVKSAILLAGLFADGPMVVREPGPARDHTERLLRAMGADVRVNQAMVTVVPRDQSLTPLDLEIPGDFSSAAFIIVAACAVPNSKVLLEGVGINTTRTGLLDVLREIGANISVENEREMGGEPVGDLVV